MVVLSAYIYGDHANLLPPPPLTHCIKKNENFFFFLYVCGIMSCMKCRVLLLVFVDFFLFLECRIDLFLWWVSLCHNKKFNFFWFCYTTLRCLCCVLVCVCVCVGISHKHTISCFLHSWEIFFFFFIFYFKTLSFIFFNNYSLLSTTTSTTTNSSNTTISIRLLLIDISLPPLIII